jgi:uncharacterized protein (TIGR02246 family)
MIFPYRTGAPAPADWSNSADAREIIEMYDTALNAFRRGDLEGVLSHWEDDGVYLWPAVPPAIGKNEIRSAYRDFFANWTAEEKFYRHELLISEELAYSRFGTQLTLTPKHGGPQGRMVLQGAHILRRTSGPWRFKMVIAVNVPEDSM